MSSEAGSGASAAAPFRVAHVLQPTHGGVPAVVLALARRGVNEKHEVTVFSPASDDFRGKVEGAGARWGRLEMTRQPSTADIRAVLPLRRVLRSFDVVHLHSSKAGALGRLARMLVRRSARIVVVPHAWSWLVGGRLAPLYRGVERLLAGAGDVFVAVSEGERAEGRSVLGWKARIDVIHNGVDVGHFRPLGSSPCGVERLRVLVVGRLCVQKGQDRALRALALLPRRYELSLVGDGPARDDLASLAHDLGVADRVHVHGSTDPLPHLQRADVVLVTSRWEGLSLSMLEAMACARPVVTTAVSGSEVIEETTGRLVPVDAEPEQIAEVLGALGEDPLLRAKLGAAAWDRAADRFSVDRMLDAYVVLWAGLFAARPDRPASDGDLASDARPAPLHASKWTKARCLRRAFRRSPPTR